MTMSKKTPSSLLHNVWLKGAFLACLALGAATLSAQEGRRIISKTTPEYPELARRMHLAGTVKLEVTILPTGAVKSATVLGGHPLLAQAALDAVKHYKFSPAGTESRQIVEFDFHP